MVSIFRLPSVYAAIFAMLLLSTAMAKKGGNLKGSEEAESNFLCVHSIRTFSYLRYKTSEAHVRVQDQRGYYPGATVVYGTWILPDGTQMSSVRSTRGVRRRAEFPLYDAVVDGQTGQFTFEVTDLVLNGYTYDQSRCSTPASVTVTV